MSRYAHVWWQLVFYLVPLALLVAISFWTISHYQLTPAFTTLNFRTVFSDPVYRLAVWNSVKLAAVAGMLSALAGAIGGYALSFCVSRRIQVLIVFGLFLPFFSSYTVRMFSWQSWLTDSGLLAVGLRKLELLRGSLGLIYSERATWIGLLSYLIPISILIVYLVISRIDRELLLAAMNLGASVGQVARTVVLPNAAPGILVAFLFSFIITFGDFVAPSVLGGNRTYTLSAAIYDRVKINDWPTAAALGTVALVISMIAFVLIFGLLRSLSSEEN